MMRSRGSVPIAENMSAYLATCSVDFLGLEPWPYFDICRNIISSQIMAKGRHLGGQHAELAKASRWGKVRSAGGSLGLTVRRRITMPTTIHATSHSSQPFQATKIRANGERDEGGDWTCWR